MGVWVAELISVESANCQTLGIRALWDCSVFTYAAKLLQLCPTLCDPIDGSPPGSPVPGML